MADQLAHTRGVMRRILLLLTRALEIGTQFLADEHLHFWSTLLGLLQSPTVIDDPVLFSVRSFSPLGHGGIQLTFVFSPYF